MSETMIGVNVRISADLRAALQAWADTEGITFSQVVRRLLNHAVVYRREAGKTAHTEEGGYDESSNG